MSKEYEGNSEEYSIEHLVNQIIKTLNEGNLEDMLRSLVSLIVNVTGAKHVDLYVYEEEHKQLRLMTPNTDNGIQKIKIKDLQANVLKPFNFNGKLAIPLTLNEKLIGVTLLTGGKAPSDTILSQVSNLLKLCLELENKNATIFKLSALEELDSSLISAPMNFDTLYNQVLDFVMRVLNAESGAIWLSGGEELIISYTHGISEKDILRRRVKIGHGMVGWIAKNSRSLLSTSSKNDPRVSNDILSFKIKSAIGVPIIKDGELIGVMMLFNRKNTDFYRTYRHFDEFDLSILKATVNRMSLSMSRIELYYKLDDENKRLKELQHQSEEYISYQREQVRLLSALQKIMKAMRNAMDIRNVYKIVLIGLTSGMGFGFNRALLLEKNKSTKTLEAKEWLGPSSEDEIDSSWRTAKERENLYADFSQYLKEEAMSIELSNGLTKMARGKSFSYVGDYIFDRVINRAKIVHVTRMLVEERKNEFLDLLNFLKVNEFVCVPLVGRREVYGAIVLDNKYTAKPITDDMIDMLRLFSESVGLTVESLKSYSELKEKTLKLEKQKMTVEYFKDFARNVLENLDVAIIVVNRENRILEWNRKSEELFEFEKEKVVNSTVNILGPEFFDIFNVAEKVYNVRETISLSDYRFDLYGKEMFLNMKFSPLLDNNAINIVGYIAMFEDVTRKHMLENEARNRERLALLGEMSARVAHEIRNPLSAIGGFAQRINKNAKDERILKYAGIILDETKRLEKIVNQTLDFSRANVNVNFVKTSLNKVVRESVELYKEKFSLNRVELELNLDENDDTVEIEPNHFKEVIINLVQNALEAVEKGSGKVKVSTHLDDEVASVKVWNNGTTIPPDKLEKIFRPFYTTKTYGTGLGLAICRKIVEDEHNGKMEAKSNGNGTVFSVTIPRKS